MLECLLALTTIGHFSICICPVLNRHQNDMTCCREPLFQQSSQFVFSVRLHSYKIFPHFSSIVVHLVHVHWLPISVALVFLQVPLPYGLFLTGSSHVFQFCYSLSNILCGCTLNVVFSATVPTNYVGIVDGL